MFSPPYARGLLAGVAGTVAEAFWSRRQARLLGRAPVFGTTEMARALILKFTARTPSVGLARAGGNAMRWTYGPLWALVWGALPGPCSRPTMRSMAALALLIWGVELVTLPWVGATPPLRAWPAVDILLDLTNASLYALVAGASLTVLTELNGLPDRHRARELKREGHRYE
ncbi:MAG: hypothetical protein DLM65_01630 [Candidatus Aeolococcus gillhamiae]|uniref:Uncharacterized protein n=2 Tax=Candidatus Aeolococcus gillhamiae TaxID=3127015 RepID=A0A2W5ZL29_9BACT|nr:MAG: hypothetical protein DLM65_01630 [Candidatus Dormibacter sp. RRmetagenome_bin12]